MFCTYPHIARWWCWTGWQVAQQGLFAGMSCCMCSGGSCCGRRLCSLLKGPVSMCLHNIRRGCITINNQGACQSMMNACIHVQDQPLCAYAMNGATIHSTIPNTCADVAHLSILASRSCQNGAYFCIEVTCSWIITPLALQVVRACQLSMRSSANTLSSQRCCMYSICTRDFHYAYSPPKPCWCRPWHHLAMVMSLDLPVLLYAAGAASASR